jgi:hypothetical protein
VLTVAIVEQDHRDVSIVDRPAQRLRADGLARA